MLHNSGIVPPNRKVSNTQEFHDLLCKAGQDQSASRGSLRAKKSMSPSIGGEGKTERSAVALIEF
jgi:hypothetical protein